MSVPRSVRPARSLVCWIVGVLALAGMLAPQANAATGFVPVGSFASGSADGVLYHQQKLAVEHSTDRVFQTNVISDQIVVWAPNGFGADQLTAFGAGQLVDPHGIAVDQSNGDVYVSDAGNNRIVRYTTDGAPVPTYTLDGTYTSPALGAGAGEIGSFAAAIALDASGNLLVADSGNDRVKRFDDTGAYDNFSFDGTGSAGVFTGLQDLAIDSTGDVIVVDSDGGDPAVGASSRVERFSSAGVWEATIGPVDTAANVAIRPATDEVVVSSNQDAINGPTYYPSLFVFDSSTNREVALTSALYNTISGIAVGDGPAGQMFAATDTSRSGPAPGFLGGRRIHVLDPVVPTAPTIDAEAWASDVTGTSATLNATVDPNNAEATYYFEYGTTAAYGSQTAPASAGSGDQPVPVSQALSGLVGSTTYHVRVVVDNGIGGPVEGSDQTFTTEPQFAPVVEPPVATATGVGITDATLNATINPGYAETTYHFEYGPTTAYGSQTAPDTAGDGNQPVAVAKTLTDLDPSTTYHYRIVADNGIGGPVEGSDQTFTTLDAPPTISLGEATGVGFRTATVQGTVDTHGVASEAVFHITQTNGPERQSASMNLGAVEGPQAVSATLADLPPGGIYRVRLTSTTSGSGATASTVGEFSTPDLPPYVATPRPPVDLAPYGCKDPKLASYEGKATPGGRVTLVGSDLGVNGTVAVGSEQAEVVDYGSSRIAIVLPSDLSGKPQVTVDCGKATNAIALSIVKPPSNRMVAKIGTNGALTLRVPGKGRLTVRGAGVRSIAKRANGKTTIRVKLKLSKAARKQLARSKKGKISRRVTISFRPAGGSARKVTRTVTFKKG